MVLAVEALLLAFEKMDPLPRVEACEANEDTEAVRERASDAWLKTFPGATVYEP